MDPIKLPLNIDWKSVSSTTTIDMNVFPPETNKIVTFGKIKQKKYFIQCNGNGHMNYQKMSDPLEEIRELAKLRDDGLITSEEFEQKKKEQLDRI